MKTTNWMLVFLGVMAAVQLSTGAARAAEVCDTLDACRVLQAKAEARIEVLSKNFVPDLTDIVRNADGKVRHMYQTEADSYCRNQGQRLPTTRELALYAQSRGAQGISETPKFDYDLIKGSDSLGNPDNFYYSNRGYQRPAGDLGSQYFWSSSVTRDDFSFFAYHMGGEDALFLIGSGGDNYGSVRCLRSLPQLML
ncbi:hypothetical protein WDW37_07025 [Bdellovibrionota bacterium FG-1]